MVLARFFAVPPRCVRPAGRPWLQKGEVKLGFVGVNAFISCVGVGEIPLLGEMSRSDKGVMAQP